MMTTRTSPFHFFRAYKETGYVVGKNAAIEDRGAEDRDDRLPALAADLIRRRVAVIATTGTPATLAAKAATTVIPIVFSTGANPVAWGLVASLNRPGANLTGIPSLTGELKPKELQLLRELVPHAATCCPVWLSRGPVLSEYPICHRRIAGGCAHAGLGRGEDNRVASRLAAQDETAT